MRIKCNTKEQEPLCYEPYLGPCLGTRVRPRNKWIVSLSDIQIPIRFSVAGVTVRLIKHCLSHLMPLSTLASSNYYTQQEYDDRTLSMIAASRRRTAHPSSSISYILPTHQLPMYWHLLPRSCRTRQCTFVRKRITPSLFF